MSKYCYGCGALLQTTNKDQIGYVPRIKDNEEMLCLRCYRSIHYHEFKKINIEQTYFDKLINDNITRKNLIVLVVDLFDLSSSLNESIFKYIKHNQILLVANKRDLILKNVNNNKIRNYLKEYVKQYSDNVIEVLITSANKKYHIDKLLSLIFEYHNNYHVYMLGLSNVGKSSLINAILKSKDINEQLITVSNYLNTTLDMIEIPLNNKVSLIDMPGLNYLGQMINYVKEDDLNYLDTKKEIKARTYQLDSDQSIYIGGLVCFSYVNGERNGFTFFVNNPLKIHRTKYDSSFSLFDNHTTDHLLSPKPINVNQASDFIKHTITIKEDDKMDIVIAGLGWITFFGFIGDEIELLLPPGVTYNIRPALI
ncbi:MAG: ribosome biogenesis GTPase YqeH [Bacilli bacterium]|jgi:ribosome biogenesis GTPase YqeH|nr:ribosome biogenesis GTPase YqeH [Bacilli bacterium]